MYEGSRYAEARTYHVDLLLLFLLLLLLGRRGVVAAAAATATTAAASAAERRELALAGLDERGDVLRLTWRREGGWAASRWGLARDTTTFQGPAATHKTLIDTPLRRQR